MAGCLRNLLAGLGCMTFLLVGGVAGWHYRVELQNAYYAFIGETPENDPNVMMGSGEPSPRALNSALDKQQVIARWDGPEFIFLTPSEVASLIVNELDPISRQALDSVKVTFRDDSFILEAQLVTEIWGREALGLLGTVLRPREALRVAGPAWIERPGVMAWEPRVFVVREIGLPRAAIPTLVNQLTGGADGLMLLAVPWTVADMAIQPGGVTFYRRVQ